MEVDIRDSPVGLAMACFVRYVHLGLRMLPETDGNHDGEAFHAISITQSFLRSSVRHEGPSVLTPAPCAILKAVIRSQVGHTHTYIYALDI